MCRGLENISRGSIIGGKMKSSIFGVALAVCLFVPLTTQGQWQEGPIYNKGQFLNPYENRLPVRIGESESGRASWDYRSTTPPGVTAVKDQAPCESCWVFASLGALEGTLRYFWPGNPNLDFSEFYLRECSAYHANCSTGGNIWMTSSHLTTYGPVEESCAPWPGTSEHPGCIWSCAAQPYRLRQFKYCDTSVASIKTALMNEGPIYCGVYASHPNFSGYSGGIITGPSASPGVTDHAVVIVGFDDNMGGAGVGGWIIKNSWGTAWGESGYARILWTALAIGTGACALTDIEQPLVDQEMYLYYNDEFGATVSYGSPSYTSLWMAQRLVPSRNGIIRRVEFHSIQDGLSFQLKIYDDRTGSTSSSALINQIGTTQNITFPKAGYCSVDLDTPISRTGGDDFYMALQCSGAAYSLTMDNSGSPSGNAWISLDNITWQNAPSMDTCIRAVIEEGPPVPAISWMGIAAALLTLSGLLIWKRS
jgi:hypothetical protein